MRNVRLAMIATTALTLAGGEAVAQTQYPSTTQDRLGAVVGALFGDRLGLSAMDQAWLRGGRPLRDGQSQFSTRVDASVRAGGVSASAATRTNTAIIDIPQTVDIVTKEFWDDIGATTFDQSFKYVANVYVRNRNAGSGDGISLRGLNLSNLFVQFVQRAADIGPVKPRASRAFLQLLRA